MAFSRISVYSDSISYSLPINLAFHGLQHAAVAGGTDILSSGVPDPAPPADANLYRWKAGIPRPEDRWHHEYDYRKEAGRIS